ncbi:hypothetical protein [Methanoregula formicica]|uniref:hypothetical protein n=1 Tax=Methanoregula formicica TaxID=882104 RepID=UPI00064EB893|nr:hypothetical protein [Methanoregula formicica]
MSTAGAPRRVRGFLVMVRDQDSVSALLPYVLIGPGKGIQGLGGMPVFRVVSSNELPAGLRMIGLGPANLKVNFLNIFSVEIL